MEAWFRAVRALIYMTAFVLFWGWLALSVKRFDQLIPLTLPDRFRLLGVVIIFAGGAIVAVCIGLFVSSGRGTPAPFDPPKQFVAIGPYKYVRNPMYVGALIALIGFGLWQQSVSILLFALLAGVIVHLFVFFLEEPDLQRRFGASYINYRASVNRWLPRQPGHRHKAHPNEDKSAC